MRVDQATFSGHRAALLDAATRLFRGRGLAGVSIGEISREAGLTHGAFYGHFPSKDALAAAACRDSLAASAAAWRARAERRPDDPIGAIIDGYLTERHRDDAANAGCALSAIGPEVAREGGDAAAALDEGARGLLRVLSEQLARLRPAADARERDSAALGILAVLAGGVLVARALAPDPALSNAALRSARQAARRLIPLQAGQGAEEACSRT